jgi:signal peptidase I
MDDNTQQQNQQQTPPAENHEFFYAPQRSATLEGVVNTLEWLLIAFILALVFRAFGVEAFQIPTGSMAETLKGAHYHVRCLRCGYAYDVGGDDALYSRPECPSCGYNQPINAAGKIQNGDRIFVLKSIYQFQAPKRWDVVVFKNPTNPQINYIKRLTGLPGETVQILDGDIFINGRIQRKPADVQSELWTPIYDNDYQSPGQFGKFAAKDAENTPWRQPFENTPGSRWNLNADGPTVFSLSDNRSNPHVLVYNSEVGNDFHSTYVYNNGFSRQSQPVCEDLMMCFWIQEEGNSSIAVCLEKDGVQYLGEVQFGDSMVLSRRENGETVELAKTPIRLPSDTDRPKYFEFANVDYRLVLRFGTQRLSFDLPVQKSDKPRSVSPRVEIHGSGKIRINHIGLFRDIYYTSAGNLRATWDKPFTLHTDEFFVCGDNSPNSSDARLWSVEGKDRMGQDFYRKGIVPMDYMMGKAFMVYWSDAFSPMPNMLPIIPNIDRLKIIYGGSDEAY